MANESPINTSFIPKRNLRSGYSGARKSTSITLVIALLLFISSSAVAGGVFLNKLLLVQSIEGEKGLRAQLAKAQTVFSEDKKLFEDITRFDSKIRAAELLLREHVSLAPLFRLLNERTLQTIRFNSFTYGSVDGRMNISLEGEAESFKSVALQSQEYVRSRRFRDVVFTDLNVDGDGTVIFSLSMSVDPLLVSYIKSTGSQ